MCGLCRVLQPGLDGLVRRARGGHTWPTHTHTHCDRRGKKCRPDARFVYSICETLEPVPIPSATFSGPLHALGLQTCKRLIACARSSISIRPHAHHSGTVGKGWGGSEPSSFFTMACTTCDLFLLSGLDIRSCTCARKGSHSARSCVRRGLLRGVTVAQRWVRRGAGPLSPHDASPPRQFSFSQRVSASRFASRRGCAQGGRAWLFGAARRTRSPCSQSSYSSCAIIRIFFSTIKPCFGSW